MLAKGWGEGGEITASGWELRCCGMKSSRDLWHGNGNTLKTTELYANGNVTLFFITIKQTTNSLGGPSWL